MNWALMANAAYDYPADALGFTTGIAIEGNRQLDPPLRLVPNVEVPQSVHRRRPYLVLPTQPLSGDGKIFYDWGMVTELEHRHTIATHPGAVRLLVFDDRMNNGSYKAAVALANEPATLAIWGTPAAFLASANGVTGGIDDTHALRNTWGIALNADQEITKNIGAFSRIGWNSGQNSGFEFTDTNWTAPSAPASRAKVGSSQTTSSAQPSSSAASQSESDLPCGRRRRHPNRRWRSELRPRKKRGALLRPQIFEVLPRHPGLPVCGQPGVQQGSRPRLPHLWMPPALRALERSRRPQHHPQRPPQVKQHHPQHPKHNRPSIHPPRRRDDRPLRITRAIQHRHRLTRSKLNRPRQFVGPLEPARSPVPHLATESETAACRRRHPLSRIPKHSP